jgi:hypothetical protein
VQSGQAGVIRLPDGYLLVTVDKKTTTAGSYRVLFSSSGHFTKAEPVVAEGEGELLGRSVSAHGHTFSFDGWGLGFTEINLDLEDKEESIALSEVVAPTQEQVNSLAFRGNHPLDERGLHQLIRR